VLPMALAVVIGIAAHRAAQVPQVPADTEIRLRRTSCLGSCPIYTVTIDARGMVIYEGEEFVRATGRHTAQIAPSIVAKLLASAERIRFFDLRDAYREIEHPDGTRSGPTDLPTTVTTLTVNGRTKRVDDYVGAPDALVEFEREIDDAAGTRRWIFLDNETLDGLGRSGWPAKTQEGAALLRQAIERDDIAIARTLIEMGADVDGPSQNRSPVLSAARSGAMVDLLVKAGADPNQRPIGAVTAMTPLMFTYHKDASVAEALLKAGARLEDMDRGHTALHYVACAGNWRVVTVLLRVGANPRGSTERSALECTRQVRQDELNSRRTALDRGRPTVADYDRVIALLENAEKRIKRE
jgi:hypothetical protein